MSESSLMWMLAMGRYRIVRTLPYQWHWHTDTDTDIIIFLFFLFLVCAVRALPESFFPDSLKGGWRESGDDRDVQTSVQPAPSSTY